jgi:periplasmic protein TonB
MYETMVINYFKFPKQAINKRLSGNVNVTFTIDSTGKILNHRVTKGIGPGCDEEALKYVKNIPDT